MELTSTINNPLAEYFSDTSIQEIMVNAAGAIWLDRGGSLQNTGKIVDAEVLSGFVRQVLSNVGRKIDRRTPFADARLSDGSRVAVVAEPAVIGGMHICIRRFPQERYSLNDLQSIGTFNDNTRKILEGLVSDRQNILVAGATGSGKTTLLNALAGVIPYDQRIILLEDTSELNIQHPHVVRFECRPPNIEGEGEISLQQLLRASLRMRPDRLLVGECRGKEAIDLLQALHTGHSGSMATIHANSARDALARLELLAATGGVSLQQEYLRAFVVAGIQAVVFTEKRNGHRRVSGIFKICGLDGGVYLLRRLDAE